LFTIAAHIKGVGPGLVAWVRVRARLGS